MPIEDDGKDIEAKPLGQTSGAPSPPASQNAKSNESNTEKLEKDIKRGEWWLIRIGIATLLINTVIAVIYWGQLQEMRKATLAATQASETAKDTLTEMRTGSGAQDTHTLAQQAVTQAQQTTALANAAGKQADAAKTLAKLTAKQLNVNQEMLESQRASLNISFGKVINPISFHDGSPSIVFSVLIQNTGAIKATHATIRFKPYYSLMGNNIFTEPLQKQRDYCAADIPPNQEWSWDANGKRIDLKGLRDWTFTVEPHSAVEREINFWMAKPTEGEIIKWPPSDVVQQNPTLTVTDRIFPIVVGCIDYQSGAIPEKHQTGFIFEVQEAYSDPAVPNAAPTLVHYGIDVPREKVIATQFFFGQGKQY